MTTTALEPHPVARHQQVPGRALAVTATVLAALIVWSIAAPLMGASLRLHTSPGSSVQTVGAGSVLVVTLLASLLGWGLLAVLEHRTRRAGTIWTVIAATALLLSLAGPLTSAVTTGGKISLAMLHLSVATVLIPLLRRTAVSR